MPRTKEIASMLCDVSPIQTDDEAQARLNTYELDLPDPLGPMIEVKYESPKCITW